MRSSLRRAAMAGFMFAAMLSPQLGVRAEDKPQEAPKAAPQDPVAPVAEKINTMLLDLVKKLKPEEQKHFFLAYSNYNLQGTALMVQGDVERAIEACGKNNPDMKTDLDKRYQDWRAAIDPVMKDSKANLDNMLKTQKYAKKKDIQAIFAEVDNAREKAQSQIQKIPVTTPEACEYLMSKMNETQDGMVSLLRSTLLSVPQAFGEEEVPQELADPQPSGDKSQDPPPAQTTPPAPEAPKEKSATP